MDCINPIYVPMEDTTVYPEGLKVACGKCLNCRVAKRREWTARMLQELPYHNRSIFLTLTYADNHLPENYSLKKKHLQNFYKSLRRDLKVPIKHFSCGEYGPETLRPHYHAVVFGLGFSDREKIMSAWPWCDWSVYTIREKSFGLVERESIQYVAGYIHSKLSGSQAEEEYDKTGREPVFRLISNGIGKQYAIDNADQLDDQGYMTINGVKMSLPRYYLNLIGADRSAAKIRSKEKDIEETSKFTGLKLTEEEAYRLGYNQEIIKKREYDKQRASQKNKNISGKINLKSKRSF